MVRAFNAVQLLVLGVAGVGAFYAVAHLSGHAWHADDLVDAADVPARGPASRTAPPSGPGAPPDRTARMAGPIDPSESAPLVALAASGGDRSAVIPHPTGDPFAVLSWLPPPPPPPKPVVVVAAPPAPPVAPALPFAFVGMVERGTAKPQAFLAKGDALLVVSSGDVIDEGAYRVDTLSPSQIVLTHLATNTRQSINVSGAAP